MRQVDQLFKCYAQHGVHSYVWEVLRWLGKVFRTNHPRGRRMDSAKNLNQPPQHLPHVTDLASTHPNSYLMCSQESYGSNDGTPVHLASIVPEKTARSWNDVISKKSKKSLGALKG